jgi:hypothetical protein
MATTTTVNGIGYKSLEFGFSSATSELVAGVYTALPPYGEPPRIGADESEQMLITYVGVDNVGGKPCGFRGKTVQVDFVVAGSTKSACEGSLETLLNGLSPITSRYSITPPGGAQIQGCQLARGSGRPSRWFTIGNQICCLLTLDFRSLSKTN